MPEQFIELAKDPDDGRWYWMLWSTHGRKLAMSPTGHKKKADTLKTLAQAREQIQDAHILEQTE